MRYLNTFCGFQSFDAGATGVGVASSAFSLARLALNIPSGMLADRYGRRPLLILGPLLMAVGAPPVSLHLMGAGRARCGVGPHA